jgi:hypothetical protein
MRLLLLLVGLGLSGAVQAQVLAPKKVLPLNPAVTNPNNIGDVLQEPINPHYVVLKNLTPVYKQVADTLGNKFVFKLVPGTRAYIRKWLQNGCLITLSFDSGERYYLPSKFLSGLSVFVEI